METTISINEFGAKVWRNKNGNMHREDGPALIYPNAAEVWWINGKVHREDGPAIIYSSGGKEWWLDDKRYTEKEWKEEIRRRKLKELNF